MQKYLLGVSALVILGFLNFSGINLSDENLQQLLSKTNLFNLRFPQERVYLHLDRPSYWADDDVWFKAYVKNSPINEGNLYIEIINATGDVVNKNIAWVQNGLAYGDFHLADTLSSGVYQVRAYTNWMRNFDEVWFFRKDLVIWNPRDKKIEADPLKLRQRDIDLQFFPEGGTFVAGVKNRVAFKTTDKQGKGIDFDGTIVDESGNKVAEIKSIYKGIGSFVFQPESGKKYTAEAVFAGNVEKQTDLPKPQNEGVLLSVDALDAAKVTIQVVEKSSKQEAYFLVAQSGGEIFYHTKITPANGTSTLELDKTKLPGGILKFTLFSSDLIPICERLTFNNQVEVVNLVIRPDKPEYKQREKVKIGVAAITGSGEPSEANLSMSVYNVAVQLKEEEFANNIFTHFLLSSELKGIIENPAWYFNNDSLTTLQALDNLMLTHGYREFEWKEILEDDFPEIIFQPEPSIEVKGRVVSPGTNKPVAGGKVTMMTLKSLLNVSQQETDSLGQFVFPELYFYDTIYVSLKAENSRGKTATVIEVDSSSSTSPESKYLPALVEYSKDKPFETITYLSETQSDLINRKWSLTDTILIGDINVMARKRYSVLSQELPRPYLEADFVYDIAAQKGLPGNIFDAIEGKIPGVIYDQDKAIFHARGDVLKIYMDGIEMRAEMSIKDFSSQMFDKVEYIKSGIFAGINYRGGVLFFYTKRGVKNLNRAPIKPLGIEGIRVIGYSVSRKFYTPVYDSPEQPEKKEDIRNTIYWNPVVMTDSSGVAIESFFQSEETGEMKIMVEGVTKDGKLCRGVTGYKVKLK